MDKKFKLTKSACYISYISQAAVVTLSPILFMTFHNTYAISYTKLGLLVIFNFVSQMLIDLVFSFFSQHFNIEMIVKRTPFITALGLIVYSIMPKFFPNNAYFWIIIGTIIFSISAGLCEVLLSPTIAALPSDNPEREMSKFHSVYAWSVVGVVIISSFFIKFFGAKNWNYLALFWSVFSFIAAFLFSMGAMPKMNITAAKDEQSGNNKIQGVILFVMCIFFGSAAENTMSQWCSSFIEESTDLSKFWGDILGLALFGVALGISRSVYGKIGKNIESVMLISFIGSVICYLIIGLVNIPLIGLISCVISGFFVSMLWPGTLIWIEKANHGAPVVAYALLAAGGDFGASVGPQLMGIITDKIAISDFAIKLSNQLSISPDNVGMKTAMLISALFPICGIVIALTIKNKFKGEKK